MFVSNRQYHLSLILVNKSIIYLTYGGLLKSTEVLHNCNQVERVKTHYLILKRLRIAQKSFKTFGPSCTFRIDSFLSVVVSSVKKVLSH